MNVEELKKGSDWNRTTLCNFINSITDGNLNFKGDYKISWKIEKLVRETKLKRKEDLK